MTLALRTATSRTPSYAAELVLGELEDGFARLGYRPRTGPPGCNTLSLLTKSWRAWSGTP